MVAQALDSFFEIIAKGKTMKWRKLKLPGLRLFALFILVLASVEFSSVIQAQDSRVFRSSRSRRPEARFNSP
jgi:hypothetical protein